MLPTNHSSGNIENSHPPFAGDHTLDEVFSFREPQQALDYLLKTAVTHLNAEFGSLRLLNRRNNNLVLKVLLTRSGEKPLTEGVAPLDVNGSSILAQVARNKQSMLISDLQIGDWHYQPLPLTEDVVMHSELAVPILSHDRKLVIGVLNVESPSKQAFSSESQQFLEKLASRALMSIQYAQLLEAFQIIGQTTLRSDQDALLTTTVEKITELMHVSVCSIWLADPIKKNLVLKKTVGRPANTPDTYLTLDSFIGQVFQTREAITTKNVLAEPRFVYTELARQEGWVSAAAVPILSTMHSEAEILGVIFLCSHEERYFTQNDINLALSFSNQVAIALKQATLLDEQDRQLKVMSSLQKVNGALLAATNLDSMLDMIVAEAAQLLNADGAILYLKNDLLLQNVVVATTNNIQSIKQMRTSLHSSLSGWVTQNNESVICLADDQRIDQNIAQKIDIRTIAAAPMAQENEVIGCLVVINKEGTTSLFTGTDLERLKLFASQTTTVINRMRLYEQSSQQSMRLRVINAILKSSLVKDIDVDEIISFAATTISQELGYKVDIGLIEEETKIILRATAVHGNLLKTKPCFKKVFKLGEGIIGDVARFGRPIIAPDVSKESRYQNCFESTQSELAVPLILTRKTIGVLNLESNTLGAFTRDDEASFSTIAAGIALALENAQRHQELLALHTIVSSINQSKDLTDVLHQIKEMMNAMACTLFVADPSQSHLTLVKQIGLAEHIIQRVRTFNRGQSIAGKVLENGEALFVQDMVTDPRADGTIHEGDGIAGLASMPIKTEQGLAIGVLNVLTADKRIFTEREQRALEAIGNNLALVLQKVELENSYTRLFDGARDAIVILDLDGTIRDLNLQAELLSGFQRTQLIGKNVTDLILKPNDQIAAQERIMQLARGETLPIQEFELCNDAGQHVFIESNPTPIVDEFGHIISIQSIWRDITKRKKDESVIHQQNKQLQGLLKLSLLPFECKTQADLQTKATKHAEQLLQADVCAIHDLPNGSLGNGRSAFTIRLAEPIITSDSGHPISSTLQKVAATGQSVTHNDIRWTHGHATASPNGIQHLLAVPLKSPERVLGVISAARFWEQNRPPFTKEDLAYFENFANNLTFALEYVRLDELQRKQHAAAQVLEQMGLVGAFLTHKLGGFLGAVAFTTRELRRYYTQPEPAALDLMNELERLSQTSAHVVGQFKQLEKPLSSAKQKLALEPLLQTAVSRTNIPTNINITTYKPRQPLFVWGSHNLLTEVFQGLICNAVDAMPDGGKLTIRSRLIPISNDLLVDFEDSGSGIDSKLAERIFEPFFSTKEEGRGLGIGLWLTRLYLHSLGGDIQVDTTKRQGARFIVRLPTAQNESGLEAPPQPDKAPTEFFEPVLPKYWPARTKKIQNILIIEDEQYWQDILRIALRERGIACQVVDNRQQASQVIATAAFDAYLVDGRLVSNDSKNQDGLEVVKNILAKNKTAQVIFLSSWEEMLSQAKKLFGKHKNVIIIDKKVARNVEMILDSLSTTPNVQ